MQKLTFGISGLLLATLSSLTADELPCSTQGKEAMCLVNPTSRFEVDNGWNYFLTTEFLWWVAKEDGLYYAQGGYTDDETFIVPPDGTKNFNGHLQRVSPDWSPGFRIGFGGNMEYDEWDIFLNWTWFKSHGRHSSRENKRGSLLVLWGHPDTSTATNAHYARGIWDLRLNLLDLELGRDFWVGKHFALRPFFGARGAWIDQDLKIRYDLLTSPETTKTKLKMESDFEGGGIRAGFDARFTLIGGWSFYGVAAASMLYGYYNCDFHEKWQGVEIAETRDGFHNAASTAQLALGVRWDSYFHCDRYHLGLYAEWEQNIWFGLNKMNRYFHNLSEGNFQQMNGDLMLQGGTFGVRFDF